MTAVQRSRERAKQKPPMLAHLKLEKLNTMALSKELGMSYVAVSCWSKLRRVPKNHRHMQFLNDNYGISYEDWYTPYREGSIKVSVLA